MSVGTDFKRIIRSGLVNFSRNPLVSAVSVMIMTVTLFLIGTSILMNALLSFSLTQISDRVDINVYFFPNTPESEVLSFRDEVADLPEIISVDYVSEVAAIAEFRERHEDDYLTIQALDELDDNPLGATLNIRAQDAAQYESIAQYLEGVAESSDPIAGDIEKINYNQNKEIIERLGSVMATIQRLGMIITGFFVLVSLLITFNTIRLAIYGAREEIAVMRLVGAENKYIRGPFMIEGVLYGVVATVLTIGLFFPITLWLSKFTTVFFGGMDMFAYYVNNILAIGFILLVAGVLLGIISSFIATRKYLKK